MQPSETLTRYNLGLRLLHWGMAALVIGMLALGLFMTSLAPEDPLRRELYTLHKSIGVTLLGLVMVRLGVRLASKVPPLPAAIAGWQRHAAHASHAVLYLFLFLMPLSGVTMSQGMGFGVPFFGLALPRIFPVDRALGIAAREVHEMLAYALITLLSLHVAAVVKHAWSERVNLLKRIW